MGISMLKVNILVFASLLGLTSTAFAAVVSKGRGGLLYDADYSAGPSSKQTNNPGQWASNISSYNAGTTTDRAINRIYPYSGDVEMNCTDNCVFTGSGKNVYVYYNTPAFGQASVASYRTSFPGATIMPIIDGSTSGALVRPINNPTYAIQLAQITADEICADPNNNGVFWDLEPFEDTSQGQLTFYQQISKLFAASTCQDSTNPAGRQFSVFVNPNKITKWGRVATMLGSNGFLVVSGYDMSGSKSPPTPESIQFYQKALRTMLTTMDAASMKYKIAYTVAIPAAASFSEFDEYGNFDSSKPGNFNLIQSWISEGITQLGYIQAAISVVNSTCKSPYFKGLDFWSWGVFKSPAPTKDWLLQPNIPPADVLSYLQSNG